MQMTATSSVDERFLGDDVQRFDNKLKAEQPAEYSSG